MAYNDSFWPSPEAAAESKKESRQLTLMRAVVRHCAKPRLPEFESKSMLTPDIVCAELSIPYYLLSTDVTVDMVERNKLLADPDDSRTVAAYEDALSSVPSEWSDNFLAVSVRWAGWSDQVIVCSQDTWPPTSTHIILVTKRRRLVMVPLAKFLPAYKAICYD